MKVETYNLNLNGRYIRKATKVILDNGREVRFTELMSAHSAIAQASAAVCNHPEYFKEV